MWGIRKFFSNTFARIFLWISIGVILAEYIQFSGFLFFIVAFISLIFMTISTLKVSKLWEWLFVVFFPFFLISLGGLMSRNKMSEFSRNTFSQLPSEIYQNNKILSNSKEENCANNDMYQSLVVDIISVPIKKNTYYRTEAIVRKENKLDSLFPNVIITDGNKLILNFECDSTVSFIPKLGDRYVISSKISLPNPIYDGAFNYGRYLKHHGFVGVGWVSKERKLLISNGNINGLRMYMLQIRERLINRYKNLGFYGESLAVLSAITLGEKGLLSDTTKSAFTISGVSHILVVSGMHVGFIYMIITFLLRRIYIVRLRALFVVFGIFLMWIYALITGFSSSVVRASFMFMMMLIMKLEGRAYRVENALSLSAVILLFINPFVIFDIGFQLSYLAVISIAYFFPYFKRMISSLKLNTNLFGKIIEWLLFTVAVSLSAQILTMPIVLFNFHQFPIYFFITNLIVSLLSPIIFVGGLMLLPMSYIPFVGELGSCFVTSVIELLDFVVKLVSNLPFAVVKQYISFSELLSIFLIILAGANLIETWKIFLYRPKAVLFLCFTVSLFTILTLYNDWEYSKKEELVMFNGGSSVVNLISSKRNIVFSISDSLFVSSRLEPIWLKYNAPNPIFISDSSIVSNTFVFEGEKYIIMRGNRFKYKKNPPERLQVDCLIIDKGIYPSERLFDKFISAKRVILSPSVWKGYHEKYKSLVKNRDIKFDIVN